MNPSLAIVIVAKLPVAGKVKTRLFARFSPESAALIHERLLVHTAERLLANGQAKIIVLFDPPDRIDAFRTLIDLPVEFLPQSGGDLGNRLCASTHALRERFDRVLFFGCDSPDVPEANVSAITEALATRQLVLGPTEDGGFWTIGFDCSVDVNELLASIPWSSGGECEAVLAKAAAMHLEVHVGARWTDVDRPSDVDALLWRLEHSRTPADIRLFNQLERIVPATRQGESQSTSPSGTPANEPTHA